MDLINGLKKTEKNVSLLHISKYFLGIKDLHLKSETTSSQMHMEPSLG